MEANIVPTQGAIDQPIAKEEVNIILELTFQGQNVILKGG